MSILNFLKKKDKSGEDKVDSLNLLDDENLTDPTLIKSHIRRITNINLKFKIYIDDNQHPYSSLFVSMEKGEIEGIMIDHIIPDSGNQDIMTSQKLSVYYPFKGTLYSFSSRYLGTIEDRFAGHKVMIPKIIKRTERRKAFRIIVSNKFSIPIHINGVLAGDATDISETGIAFYCDKSQDILKPGKIINVVSFNLPPSNNKISTQAVIRRFIDTNLASKGSKTKCCIEFLEMRMGDADKIAGYVMERQREIIRDSRGTET